MTISDIAIRTGYTPRAIQLECQSGRLKAVKERTGAMGRPGWVITHTDYLAWRSAFKIWRKPYKGRK